MSSKLSKTHYRSVIRGDWRLLLRYAAYGEPVSPAPHSLVGMSRSHKKRKARELAFWRVKYDVVQTHRQYGPNTSKSPLTFPIAYKQARREYGLDDRASS